MSATGGCVLKKHMSSIYKQEAMKEAARVEQRRLFAATQQQSSRAVTPNANMRAGSRTHTPSADCRSWVARSKAFNTIGPHNDGTELPKIPSWVKDYHKLQLTTTSGVHSSTDCFPTPSQCAQEGMNSVSAASTPDLGATSDQKLEIPVAYRTYAPRSDCPHPQPPLSLVPNHRQDPMIAHAPFTAQPLVEQPELWSNLLPSKESIETKLTEYLINAWAHDDDLKPQKASAFSKEIIAQIALAESPTVILMVSTADRAPRFQTSLSHACGCSGGSLWRVRLGRQNPASSKVYQRIRAWVESPPLAPVNSNSGDDIETMLLQYLGEKYPCANFLGPQCPKAFVGQYLSLGPECCPKTLWQTFKHGWMGDRRAEPMRIFDVKLQKLTPSFSRYDSTFSVYATDRKSGRCHIFHSGTGARVGGRIDKPNVTQCITASQDATMSWMSLMKIVKVYDTTEAAVAFRRKCLPGPLTMPVGLASFSRNDENKIISVSLTSGSDSSSDKATSDVSSSSTFLRHDADSSFPNSFLNRLSNSNTSSACEGITFRRVVPNDCSPPFRT